jgi:biopolymer transport protein TolR
MPKLTSQQRAHIRRRSKYHEPDPSELASELNIVPILDIVVNLIMFLLATSEAVLAIIQIEAQLPQLSGASATRGDKKEPGLNLNVTLTESGVIVTGSGGKLAPGCQDVASGRVITVAKKAGQYDWPGLTECVSKIKAVAQFSDEHEVIIGADPMIQYEHVVAAMDALRGDKTKELFPDVLLSAGVR